MLIASGFSWFHLVAEPIEALESFTHGHGYIVLSAWFVCGLLVLFGWRAGSQLRAATERPGLERYHPDESLTARNVAEMIIGALMGLMDDLMDRADTRRFLPLIAALALYIFTCNILAIFPGFQPPTDNINTNVGMAIIVMLTYWVVGLTRDAKGFVGHLLGPVAALAPLMLVIELISLLAVRPGSLSIRLTGNIFGDHTVYNIMSGLVPLVVPAIFLALAMLVSLIQAGVFSLLTTIYISQSLPHGDHGDDDHH